MWASSMMRRLYALTLTLVISVLAGCSSYSISTDYNPQLDTRQWQSFRWDMPELHPKDPYDNDLTRKRVTTAVNQALADKGFTLTDAKPADFTLSYFFLVEPRLDVHRFYNHRCPWADCRYSRFETYISEYQHGSIIVDIKNGRTGELEWRGVAGSRITEGATPEERKNHINQAITELMKEFPPETLPAGAVSEKAAKTY